MKRGRQRSSLICAGKNIKASDGGETSVKRTFNKWSSVGRLGVYMCLCVSVLVNRNSASLG